MNKNTLIRLALPYLIRFAKAGFKNPKALLIPLLFLSVIAGAWYGYETQVARPAMTFMGEPKEIAGHATHPFNHTLRNQAYMLGYSENLKNPLWVTYKVTQDKVKYGKRPGFDADWRSPFGIHTKDYTRSGFDRGHMAPNYVIASRYGRAAQKETFLMTNVTPQRGRLNRKSWQRFEQVIADDFSKKFPIMWVVTGPVFSDEPDTIKGTDIAIPNAFYKIVMRQDEATHEYHALAMLFPQNARANASLLKFVTTVDNIEKQTGLDFFSDLPDNIEKPLEKAKNHLAWSLADVANRKNKY